MSDVYETIADRMKDVADVEIAHYIGESLHKSGSREKSLTVYTSTLDGIEFFFKSPHELHQQRFIDALNNSKTSFARPTFVSDYTKNFAIKCSFGVTEGRGFREIRYLPPQSRVDELVENMRTTGASSAAPMNLQWKLDANVYQSLHLAISNGKCKIHIDDVGFVIGTDAGLVVTIDAGQHIVNELFYKTFGKWLIGKVPVFSQFIIDHTEIITPHTVNGFRSVGPVLESGPTVGFQAHANFINTQNAFVGAAAAIEYDISSKSWSGSVMGRIEIRHDVFGGASTRRRRRKLL